MEGDRAKLPGRADLRVWRDIPKVRWIIQGLYTLFYLLVAFEFYYFYTGVKVGDLTLIRPPAVEGFLPISSLLGLRYFVATGVYDHVHPAGLTIMMAVIASALLTRKSLCGWVCPVGFISRGLESGGRRVFKNKVMIPPVLDHMLLSVKYLLCFFFVYVIFFRMTTVEVSAFLNSSYNVAADAKMLLFFSDISSTTVIVLLALSALSFVIKNFWCRYLCPYGAFLGIFSFFSPLAIKRDEAICIDCETCTLECPYQIRVHKKRSVRTVECTACLNCVSSCPVDDCLTVGFMARKKIRRALVPAILLFILFSFYLGARVTRQWHSKVSKTGFARVYSIVEELDHPR